MPAVRPFLTMLGLVPTLLLGACTVGPDYHRPGMPAPQSFPMPDAKAAPLSQPVAGEADLSHWWRIFHDRELDSLIGRALAANLDLKTAASRVREAREQEIVAGAAGLPSVSAQGAAAHVHSGNNPLAALGGGSSSGGGSGGGSSDLSLYSLGFDATWEVDLFGGTRRSIEAAEAGTEAARWQMRDGEVSLTAEIATDYFDLRGAQTRLAILRDQLKSQQATLELVAARAHTGFVTQLDVNQQAALHAGTEAQIPSLETEVRADEHAIAVLLAVDPEALSGELDATGAIPTVPTQLPVGLPSDLLRRRPDVRAAERKLAQATAQKGVEIAALYPKFDLLGGLFAGSNGVDTLFNSSSLSEMVLGSISWPIFNAGKLHANIRASEEERLQAYYAYKQAVLGAIRDADDALVRYAGEQRRFLALQREVARDRSSTTIAEQQYRAGMTNFINVLTAENSDLQAEDMLAQSRQALTADLASLYKALGGGWQADRPEDKPQQARPSDWQ